MKLGRNGFASEVRVDNAIAWDSIVTDKARTIGAAAEGNFTCLFLEALLGEESVVRVRAVVGGGGLQKIDTIWLGAK